VKKNAVIAPPQASALWRVLSMLTTRQVNSVMDIEMMLMTARNVGEAIVDNARTTGYLAELFKAAYGRDIDGFVPSCKADKLRESPTMAEEFAELMCWEGLIIRIALIYMPPEEKLADLDTETELEAEEKP
jgi:hypothetical protein